MVSFWTLVFVWTGDSIACKRKLTGLFFCQSYFFAYLEAYSAWNHHRRQGNFSVYDIKMQVFFLFLKFLSFWGWNSNEDKVKHIRSVLFDVCAFWNSKRSSGTLSDFTLVHCPVRNLLVGSALLKKDVMVMENKTWNLLVGSAWLDSIKTETIWGWEKSDPRLRKTPNGLNKTRWIGKIDQQLKDVLRQRLWTTWIKDLCLCDNHKT